MEKEAFESLMEGIKREDTKLPTLCLHDESSGIGHYEGRYEGDEEFQVGVYLIGFTATANQFGRRYAEETRWLLS